MSELELVGLTHPGMIIQYLMHHNDVRWIIFQDVLPMHRNTVSKHTQALADAGFVARGYHKDVKYRWCYDVTEMGRLAMQRQLTALIVLIQQNLSEVTPG